MKLTKKDYIFAAIIAEIDALIILYLQSQGEFTLPDIQILSTIMTYLYIILPVICIIALWLANEVSKFIKGLIKIAKFVLVGTSNVFIDTLGFVLLRTFFGAATDIVKTILKAGSFLIATANSYFWNKTWTFQEDTTKEKSAKEITTFYIVTIIGLLVNSGAFYLFRIMFATLPDTAIVILVAFISAVWNFVGYKLFVFKK